MTILSRRKTAIFLFALSIFGYRFFYSSLVSADNSPSLYNEIFQHVRDDMLVLPPDPAACTAELLKMRRGENQCKDRYAQWYTKEEYNQEYGVDEPIINFQKDGQEVLRISSFGRNTANDFQQNVLALENRGAHSFILDLQYNDGGFISSTLKFLYLFAKPNDIFVTSRYREGKEEVHDTAFVAREYGITVSPGALRGVVIEEIWVNGQTASAAEIVAGVMQEWGYRVRGGPTFGKGVGQTLFDLSDGSVLSITTFEALIGNAGVKLNGIGVHPNK